MFEVSPGDEVIDQFPVFQDDGITKASGLIQNDFTVSVWRNGATEALDVEIVEIDSSGEYKLSYTPLSDGYWKVEVFQETSGEYYISRAAVGIGASLTGVKGDTARILGLLHMNSMLDQHVYNAAGQLLSTRKRVFNAPGNVPSSPGGDEEDGLIQEYSVEASYVQSGPGAGRLEMFVLKRVK